MYIQYIYICMYVYTHKCIHYTTATERLIIPWSVDTYTDYTHTGVCIYIYTHLSIYIYTYTGKFLHICGSKDSYLRIQFNERR